jgi:lysozyme
MFNGILDLSDNNTIDLAAAKQAGIVAVIHKATEGATYQDTCYASRRAEAAALGLLWGAYHFGTAATLSQQIANFLQAASPGTNDLVALDYETNTADPSDQMSEAEAEAFVAAISANLGFLPLIYGSDLLASASPTSSLASCKLWLADYTSAAQPIVPTLFEAWTLWQFTDGTNPVPFLTAGVALDRSNYAGTEEQLTAAWPFRG